MFRQGSHWVAPRRVLHAFKAHYAQWSSHHPRSPSCFVCRGLAQRQYLDTTARWCLSLRAYLSQFNYSIPLEQQRYPEADQIIHHSRCIATGSHWAFYSRTGLRDCERRGPVHWWCCWQSGRSGSSWCDYGWWGPSAELYGKLSSRRAWWVFPSQAAKRLSDGQLTRWNVLEQLKFFQVNFRVLIFLWRPVLESFKEWQGTYL